MAPKKEKQAPSIEVHRVEHEQIKFCIRGKSAFVHNSMSAKVKQDLLLPPRKKSRMEKETTLKHDPLAEYRRSPYRSSDDAAPTRIVFPAAGFKRAMATAALELPGVKKTQIGRLCWAEGFTVPIFGIPQLWMTTVRSADMNRTPDVRTRAIMPEWASIVTVSYVTPNLRAPAVVNLMSSAGIFIGVGDGRPEKGALSFGQFEVVREDDEAFQRIMKTGGRDAQDAALESPTAFDMETEELLEWWQAESARRGFEVAA